MGCNPVLGIFPGRLKKRKAKPVWYLFLGRMHLPVIHVTSMSISKAGAHTSLEDKSLIAPIYLAMLANVLV